MAVAVLTNSAGFAAQPLPFLDIKPGPEHQRLPPGHAATQCLKDPAGHPVLLLGDAAWSLIVQLRPEEAERYLQDRSRRGFNALLVNLIEHKFAVQPPRNAYGEAPFEADGDFSRPNERYFAHVDWVLNRAASHGFIVLLAPAYLGYEGGDEGWYSEMRKNTLAVLRGYGRYLGTRYRNMKHLIWMEGGDYNTPDRERVQAIVDGIREMAPASLHSFHAARGTAARPFLGETTSWLSLNTIYTDEHKVKAAALQEYRASSLPFILVEARYEGEGASEAVVRAQAYLAILSGACGHIMGNKTVWRFADGWQNALDSPGARSMTLVRQILKDLDWQDLQPNTAILMDEGKGADLQSAAASRRDNQRAVIYIAASRKLRLDLRAFRRRPVQAVWIDPSGGQRRPPIPLTGPIADLEGAGVNASGFEDWLLLLQSSPVFEGRR